MPILAQGIGSCYCAHICKSCPEATLRLTAAFPTNLSSSAFETPPSRRKIAPNLPVKNAVRLMFWQSVPTLERNLSLLVVSWVHRAPVTQPQAFSLSFLSWSTELPRPNTSFALPGSFPPSSEALKPDVTQAILPLYLFVYLLGNQTFLDGLTLIKTSPSGIPSLPGASLVNWLATVIIRFLPKWGEEHSLLNACLL